MLTLFHLCLLLTVFSTLVSAEPSPSFTGQTVYNNCSGEDLTPLPNSVASTSFFKPQVRVNSWDVNKHGIGWEEWNLLGHNLLPDGSIFTFSYKWARGDPTSANISHDAFIALAYFPNGTFYRQIVHDPFRYKENEDGGFTLSIAENHLTWDPVSGLWNTSVNAGGWVTETTTENFEPDVPFVPNYKSVPGQLSDDFFSRIEVPRGHMNGYMTFPWGLNITIFSVGTLKHTWSYKVMADVISAYVRGSTFLPNFFPLPIATFNWFQTWDSAGKEVDSMQYLLQPDGTTEGQVFRLQITDAPDILSIVTTPKPVSLPLSYDNTEITIPMCGPGADFEHGDQKLKWKANNVRNLLTFVDFAGGVTLYQEVNITGVVWVNGTSLQVAGGIGVVEVYHR